MGQNASATPRNHSFILDRCGRVRHILGHDMPKVNFSIRIEQEIRDRLDTAANKDDRTRNRLIEQVLAEKTGVVLDPLYSRDEDEKA